MSIILFAGMITFLSPALPKQKSPPPPIEIQTHLLGLKSEDEAGDALREIHRNLKYGFKRKW